MIGKIKSVSLIMIACVVLTYAAFGAGSERQLSSALTAIPCPERSSPSVFSVHFQDAECFSLSIEGDSLVEPQRYRSSELHNNFSEGGLFEIVVDNTFNDTAATICPYLTLRMAWSSPSDEVAQATLIPAKKKLFDELMTLHPGERGSVNLHFSSDSAFHSSQTLESVRELNPRFERTCLGYFLVDGETGAYIRHPDEPSMQ